MLKWFFVFVVAVCAAAALAQDAKIKPGDVLRMTCEEEPTLNKEYTVTEQGVILVDFLGAVSVLGLTEQEAAKTVSDRLVNERILRQATVRIKIAEANVAPVTYKGAVKSTGQEPFRQGLRLSDIVRKAQPREDADLSRIEVRNEQGATIVDFTQFDPATNDNNPLLKPGDTVTFLVKSAPGMVVLLGAVQNAGGVAYERGMTVRSAIARAGGFTSLAVTTTVRLERKGRPAQTLDLSKPDVDAPVREGDRIIVAQRDQRLYVQIAGAVAKGGYIEFSQGMTLTQLLNAAGGLRPEADQKYVVLTRTGQTKGVAYDLTQIAAKKVNDPTLAPGDSVIVGARKSKKNDFLQSLTVLALLYILIGR